MKGSFCVTHLFGIPILINGSWFLILLFMTFTLSSSYFPEIFPHLAFPAYLWMSLAVSLLLFGSILLHELAHALVAMRSGMKVASITLFIFGGVAHMRSEPGSPGAELSMAIAGPLLSSALGSFFLFLHHQSSLLGPQVTEISLALAYANFVLAGFNLVPAFPLDGGRVFRALLWSLNKNLKRATRYSSWLGQAFAAVIVIWGLYLLAHGYIVNGIWSIFVGGFLAQAAAASYQAVRTRKVLENFTVSELMTREIRRLSPEVSVEEAVRSSFLLYKHGGFPVLLDDQLVGIVTLQDIRRIPGSRWATTTIQEIMTPRDKILWVHPQIPAHEAFSLMNRHKIGRLPVLEDECLVGIITRSDLMQVLALEKE